MGKDKDLVRRLENFCLLSRHLREVALRGSSRDSNAAAVARVAALIGEGRINASMFGRYLEGGQKAEVQPSTYLSFAEFFLKAEAQTWGPTLDDALTRVYDWVVYGPDGAPDNAPADRHRGRPSVASIQAGKSPRIAGLSQDIPDMTLPEIVEAMESLIVALRWRLEGSDDAAPAMAAEPPCNDDNPLASLIYVSMRYSRPCTEGERQEIVAELSEQSQIPSGRCRAILCGDSPTQAEIDALAGVVGMKAEHLSMVIGRFP